MIFTAAGKVSVDGSRHDLVPLLSRQIEDVEIVGDSPARASVDDNLLVNACGSVSGTRRRLVAAALKRLPLVRLEVENMAVVEEGLTAASEDEEIAVAARSVPSKSLCVPEARLGWDSTAFHSLPHEVGGLAVEHVRGAVAQVRERPEVSRAGSRGSSRPRRRRTRTGCCLNRWR